MNEENKASRPEFDDLINEYFRALDQGQKILVAKLKPFMEVYLQLIGSGVAPEKARRIMDLYLE